MTEEELSKPADRTIEITQFKQQSKQTSKTLNQTKTKKQLAEPEGPMGKKLAEVRDLWER